MGASSRAVVVAVLASAPLAPDASGQEPTTAAPASKSPGFEWTFGEYALKLGGFVKVDLIHDFDQIGSEDTFDPRTIPVQHDPTLPEERTRLHARESRINLDASGPVHLFVEGDFFGDGSSFRLRQAYGEIDAGPGRLLAGQTWTTFMDVKAMPETLDFESPTAFPQVRQTMARWTCELGGGSYVAFAVEDPDSEVSVPAGTTGSASEPIPDLNAGLNWAFGRGHVRLGLWGGWVEFDTPTSSNETAPLWGVNLATKLETFGRDSAIAQVTWGDGIGRYRGGDAATLDASGDLDAFEVIALMAAYQHHWSDELRSNAVLSWAAGVDPPSGIPPSTTDRVVYVAANLIWQFSPRAWTGVEYLYGSIDTTGHDHGAANRVQMSIRFDL